jgi:hypothetical protein
MTTPVTPDSAVENETEFSSAFEQFTTPGDAPESSEPVVEEAPVDDEPAPAASSEEDEGEALPPEVEAEESTETDTALSDEDMMRRLASLVRRADPDEQRPAVPADAQPVQYETPLYTDEEQQVLAKYVEDWPDVAQAEALRRRGEYKQLVDYVFNEIAQNFAPVLQSTQAMAQHQHLSALVEQVPDYGVVRDHVIEWAMQQPPYLKAAYGRVIEQGTADEVVDLINRYRAETGTSGTPAVRSPAAPKATELSTQAKKAAAALAPVSSKRSTSGGSLDPLDFDNAFSTFASKL